MKKIAILIMVCMLAYCGPSYSAMVNKVVAVVNDEVITQQDVDQLLAVLYAQYVQTYKKDELLKKMEEAKKDILNQMIEDKLVLSRAKALVIKVTDEEIQDKLDYVKSDFPSEEEFFKTLETQGITVATLKERYRDQIMMKKAVDAEVRSRVSVLPSEISEYYEKHKDEFKKAEKYKVKNILIKAGDPVSFELARVEAENVYNKLKEGNSFDQLARDYSKGPNAENGGDLGYIEQGQMLKELDDVIFKLKPGEFSEPVKSEIGYHVFKVEDIKAEKYTSMAEVNKEIELALFKSKFKSEIGKWIDGLKSKAYISIK